ncbi:MAG TPA: hypothetical protein PKE32_06565 [Miltoncostaeaceae bacterium]|nr:hypothetical protein [Miltoncostaeaceae bacterium]
MRTLWVTTLTGGALAMGLVAAGGAVAQQPTSPPSQPTVGVRAACTGGVFAGRWQRPDGSIIEFTQAGAQLFGSGLGINQTMSGRARGDVASGTFTVPGGSGSFSLTLSADRSAATYMGTTFSGAPDGPYVWTFTQCDPQTVTNPVGANLGSVIPAPQVVGAGPTSIVAPGIISIGSFTSSKCVLVRVASAKPARTLVTIFSGTRSRRLFGQKLVVFRQPGAQTMCIKVPARAKTFNMRTKLGLALGYSLGATPRPKAKPTRPTIKPIKLVP